MGKSESKEDNEEEEEKKKEEKVIHQLTIHRSRKRRVRKGTLCASLSIFLAKSVSFYEVCPVYLSS